MIKKILSVLLLAVAALAAQAYNVNDNVYSKVGKYQITGENLVVNGQFKEGETGMEGWDTVSINQPLETTFTLLTGGPNGSNTQQVLVGAASLEHGMRQNIHVTTPGVYVVSLSVKGVVAGFTDHDLIGGNTNYINAYYNTDKALAKADIDMNFTNLNYGENGVCNAYQFSFSDTMFTEVVFPVKVPAEGYIILDFRGLNEGLQIADVECHLAEEVYDDRVAKERIAYLQNYLNSEGIEERMYFWELQECIQAVEEGIEQNVSPTEMASLMENLELVWELFVEEIFDNVMDYIPTTDGSVATGNNSANWMYWTGKYNKLSHDYMGTAPWSWSTDRWHHKTAEANSPLQIQWMRGAGANDGWNNIATLTATLKPGTYYWGVTGQGGMMTLNKNRWTRSWADECAETQLFFNGDTVFVGILNAARNQDYVVEFVLEEEKEVTLGLICNNVSTLSENCGFDVQFYSPVLYKLHDGGLTMEEQAYLDNAAQKLADLEKALDVAFEYASNDLMPWGREALEVGIAEIQFRYDEWASLSQGEMLGMLYDGIVLSDVIENEGTLVLNETHIASFIAINKPFTDIPGAIDAAWDAHGKRIYSSSSKMQELESVIAETTNIYNQMLKSAYSEVNAATLILQKAKLEEMVEAFKEAVNKVTLVDIDFGTQESPAMFDVNIETDENGVENYTYTITGAKGTMVFTDVRGTASDGTEIMGSFNPYELGYNATDSLGMLRVGNGEAVVDLGNVDANIVNVKFDLYAGRLPGKNVGYKLLTAEGDIICGLFFSAYSLTDKLNTFGVDYTNNISSVGSSIASNPAIAAETNKTSFDIVLDYGIGKMYCTTSGSKGTVTTEEVDIVTGVPRQFVLYSDYNNSDRRCWFDNLKIQNIGATAVQPGPDVEPTTGNALSVQNVEVFSGTSFAFPVSMTNEDGICAFQCDVYLSDGLVMNLNDEGEYDVTLSTARKTSSHTVTASLQSDGAIRVIAYSSANKLFRGNSGELFNLNLTALEGANQNQRVQIRNIHLSTADEQEYLSPSVSASVIVRSYIPGDANGDGEVTIVDVVAVVNALMGTATGDFIFDAADMDHNGQITIVDVVAVVNALMGKDVQAYGARSLLRGDIHIADAEVNADGTATFYVKLDNAQAYTAMQMDVDLPEGLDIEGVKMVGCPAHTVVFNEEGSIAAYSLNNSRFNPGESLMAITVKADADFAGNALVGFTNVRVVSTNVQEAVLSDVLANIAGGGATGIDGVQIAETVQTLYYSVTGAVSETPHQGLNIIKRISENGRVEVSKEVCE